MFSQVVAAYMDVILNQAVVGLNRNNVEVLRVNLEATRDRFEIGDLTRTDVAQSQARLALARTDLRTAEANLIRARERYIQLVGKPPVDLEPPPPLPGLPASAEDAVAVALDSNPDLHRRPRSAQGRRLSTCASPAPAACRKVERVHRARLYRLSRHRWAAVGGNRLFAQRQTTAQAGMRATDPAVPGRPARGPAPPGPGPRERGDGAGNRRRARR